MGSYAFSSGIIALAWIGVASAGSSDDIAFINPLKEVSIPIGWIQFCNDHSDDCDVPQMRATTIQMTQQKWDELRAVNDAVNGEITPETDPDHWHVAERWSYPVDGRGDCEDYVLEKRRRLLKAGWPRQGLLITVVMDQHGEGHAVLMVKTNQGDFSLDNLDPDIKLWSKTGYKYVKQQSQENPNVWRGLGEVDTQLFTAK